MGCCTSAPVSPQLSVALHPSGTRQHRAEREEGRTSPTRDVKAELAALRQDDARAELCALLRRRACRNDRLITCMALTSYLEGCHVEGSPRVPPLIPMMMQMINTATNLHGWLSIPFKDEDMLNEPNWLRVASLDAKDIKSLNDHIGGYSQIRKIMFRTDTPEGASWLPNTLRPLIVSVNLPPQSIDGPTLQSMPRLRSVRVDVTEDVDVPLVGDDWFPHLPIVEYLCIYERKLLLTDRLLRCAVVALPRLTHLALECNGITSLDCLDDVPLLSSLTVRSARLTTRGIQSLSRCKVLHTVRLTDCPEVSEVSALTSSPTLKNLSLEGDVCRHASLAEVVRRVATLTQLSVNDCSEVVATAVMAASPRLKVISSFGDNADAAGSIMVLPAVTTLTFRAVPRADLDLSVCVALTSLTISDIDMTVDLSKIDSLPSLTSLKVDGWRKLVKYTGCLCRSQTLKELHTHQNDVLERIEHLAPLRTLHCWVEDGDTLRLVEKCRGLRKLWISGDKTRDEDLMSLKSLLHLEEVFLSSCRNITDVSLLSLLDLPCLRKVNLYYCRKIADAETVASKMNRELASRRLESSWYLAN